MPSRRRATALPATTRNPQPWRRQPISLRKIAGGAGHRHPEVISIHPATIHRVGFRQHRAGTEIHLSCHAAPVTPLLSHVAVSGARGLFIPL
jgi:hypothetical protein